jgi:CRP-like cAMP-binding protein
MTISDRVTFLQERTPLAVLQPGSLSALARHLQPIAAKPDQLIVEAGQDPNGLYILLQGRLETEAAPAGGVSFLPGTVLNLEALLLDQPVEQTVKALCDSTLWWIETAQFQRVVEAHPDILQTFTRQLVEAVKRLSFQFNYEQERQAVLRPYLVTRAKRG